MAFCTNANPENVGIRFTYLSYDNQFPGDDTRLLENLIKSVAEDTDRLFIITDTEAATEYARGSGIACAALLTPYNRSCAFSQVLYCIEDISQIPLYRVVRMWQRHHGIPWTITVTDRLVIREQTEDDLEGLYRIYADPEASRFTEDLYEDPREEAEYLRKYIENQYRFYEFGLWALTLKENGKLIGRAGISIREGYQIPEAGYIIGKEYRCRGYAEEAMKAIIAYGRSEFGFEEYMAFTKEQNVPSVRLLKSLGFEKRGYDLIMGENHAMYILTKQQ
ncbi:MAG: GNAT family N-acetyltransferase [Lachnospiraceae bacterium]|nr:GNAT family N-acetyltransferase [Lachnospiraceae bacterium]